MSRQHDSKMLSYKLQSTKNLLKPLNPNLYYIELCTKLIFALCYRYKNVQLQSTKYVETVKTVKPQLKLHRVMYITNICNMFRHTTLFCYVHLLNVTYVHKNFISCHVGLSFQKLKLLKNNHKILRPTTLISCRMMQEDWEGTD